MGDNSLIRRSGLAPPRFLAYWAALVENEDSDFGVEEFAGRLIHSVDVEAGTALRRAGRMGIWKTLARAERSEPCIAVLNGCYGTRAEIVQVLSMREVKIKTSR